jgi:alcohol dehydrogenase class IV
MSLGLFRSPEVLITGTGSRDQIGIRAKELGATKALVVTDKVLSQTGLISEVTTYLEQEGIAFDIIDEVIPEPPFENLEQIFSKIDGRWYDLLVGIGGGSALDITKILAVMFTNKEDVRNFIGIGNIKNKGIPFMLLPTTAGTGSEVTFNAIFADRRDDVKKGIVSPFLLPDVAIVDTELTLSCPPRVTAASGMDALVHAIESYTALRARELTDGIALQAIKLISRSLRTAVHNGQNIKAREDMAMGSLLAGISLANAGVGAVHALAYPLGGKYHVTHGESNSMLLPYVMRYNVVANVEKFAEVAKALGENTEGLSLKEAAKKVVKAMEELGEDISIPKMRDVVTLSDADIEAMAEEAMKQERLMNNNPRKLCLQDVVEIYKNTYYERD